MAQKGAKTAKNVKNTKKTAGSSNKKVQNKNVQTKKTQNKKRKPQQSKAPMKKTYSYAAIGAWMILAAVLLGIFTYSSGGILSDWIKTAMLGLFSTGAYLVPIVILALGIYVFEVKRTNKIVLKTVLSLIEVALIGALIMLFYKGEFPQWDSLWGYGVEKMGGGVLGGSVAMLLSKLIGRTASVIVVLAVFAVLLSMIFNISFVSIVGSAVSSYRSSKSEHDETEEDTVVVDRGISEKIARAKKKRDEIGETVPADIDVFSHGEERTEVKKPKKTLFGKVEKEEKAVDNTEEVIDMGFLEEVASQLPQTEGVKELLEEQKKKSEENEKPKKVSAATEEEKAEVKNEIEESIEKTAVEYKFPPIELLKSVDVVSSDKRREMYETANKLMKILKDFGVEAKLIQVTQGPTVTRYEIQPSTGIKLAKITSLAEDIALNLAVPTVLVAAVPGKAAVGIEVPNNTVGTVSARELLESEGFKNAKSKLAVALGKDIGGNVVIGDIGKFPHVLIAGATGSGKSVCINTIITSILYKAHPDEVKLIMIDPKVVELGVYNGIPHLLIPVVTDPKKAAGALNWAVGEMMRRYSLFAETATRNLKGYNDHVEKEGGEKLPQIVIIIDELADLMMVAAKEVEDYICRLAQLARAAGIHLIIATQRPSVDVITGLIKANVPSRIAFAVSSGVDSRTILDKVGAEKLLGKGDMLYHPTGLPNALRVQGAFVSDKEIENVIEFTKVNSEETHYAHDLAEHIERVSTGENGVTDEDESEGADELLPQAIELAAELGQISTAMIQRKMKVGYARAGRIIDQMETRGLISGPNGSKPREVYLNRIRGAQEELPGLVDEDEESYDDEE